MMPYMLVNLDPIGEFFTRTVGICFLMLTLGRTHLGVSKAAWEKQTMIFHVGMLYFFYKNGTSTEGLFNPCGMPASAHRDDARFLVHLARRRRALAAPDGHLRGPRVLGQADHRQVRPSEDEAAPARARAPTRASAGGPEAGAPPTPERATRATPD